MKMALRALLMLLIVSFLLAACGGTETPTPGPATPTTGATGQVITSTTGTSSTVATPTTALMAASPTAGAATGTMSGTMTMTGTTPVSGTTGAITPTAAASGAVTPTVDTGVGVNGGNADQITIGMSQEPDTLFSPNAQASVATYILGAVEGNGLIGIDNQANLFPEIAERVPTLQNGDAKFTGTGADQHLEITWHIKQGLKWADGSPITAHDVVYAWQSIYENPNVQVVSRTAADKFKSVVASDDNTVVGTMLSENEAKALYAKDKNRYASYQNQSGAVVDPLFATLMPIYPEHAYGKLDATKIQASDFGRAPLGAGPYKVDQWIAGQAVVLVPNPNYNLTNNKPAFKKIVFKIVGDTNQLLAQLQTGTVDLITSDATTTAMIPQLDQIARSGKIKPYYVPGSQWEHADFNLNNPLFQDKSVRQAIGYAINRQQIVDKVLYGKSVVLNTWITPNITQFYATDLNNYAYNPDKARQLLDAAGWTVGSDGIRAKNGKKFSFKYSTTAGNAYRQAVSQLITADLRGVGIDAQLQFIPAQQFFGPQGPITLRTFDIAEFTWVSAPDPGCDLYTTAGIPTQANGYTGQNDPGWSNAANDKLLNQACNDATIALDPTKRAVVYKQEQKIFNDELPVLPLHVRLDISAAPTGLQNYKPTGSSIPFTWNIADWRLAKLTSSYKGARPFALSKPE